MEKKYALFYQSNTDPHFIFLDFCSQSFIDGLIEYNHKNSASATRFYKATCETTDDELVEEQEFCIENPGIDIYVRCAGFPYYKISRAIRKSSILRTQG